MFNFILFLHYDSRESVFYSLQATTQRTHWQQMLQNLDKSLKICGIMLRNNANVEFDFGTVHKCANIVDLNKYLKSEPRIV